MGTILEGVGASLGPSWVMGEGLQAQCLGKWHLGPWCFTEASFCHVFCLLHAFVIPCLRTLAGAMPSLLWSFSLPPFCLTVGPDQKPLLPRCPPPLQKHWSSAGCVCCCWKAVHPLTTNPHCSPACFQILEEGPSVV